MRYLEERGGDNLMPKIFDNKMQSPGEARGYRDRVFKMVGDCNWQHVGLKKRIILLYTFKIFILYRETWLKFCNTMEIGTTPL